MREKNTAEHAPLRDRPQSTKLSNLKVIRYLIAPYTAQISLAVITLFLSSGLVLAFGVGIRTFVNGGVDGSAPHLFQHSLIGLLGIMILLALTSFGRSYCVSWLGERIASDLRRAVFNRIIGMDMSFFERLQSGEIITRLTNDTTLIQIVVGTSAFIAMRNLLILIGGLVMMFILSAKLTLYTVVVVVLVIVPLVALGRRLKRRSQASQTCIAHLGAFLNESLTGIQTLQAFTHEAYDRRAFQKKVETSFQAAVQQIRTRATLSCLVMILVSTGLAVVLWTGAQDVSTKNMSSGDLSAFLFYAILVAASASSFSEIYADLKRAAGAAERLVELMAIRPTLQETDQTKLRTLPTPARGIVALHGLTFAYPSYPELVVLQNFNLSISPGEKVAIVGPSGAGKSTIFNLLLRFYDAQSGTIYIDGVNSQLVPLQSLRQRIGIVSQDPVIFSTSLYENILYGRPNASEEEVWTAVEFAHLTEFILSLPQGINSKVGTQGMRLSGGQKQRLAIARALLKDPAILLLDEATNALDAASEDWIQRSLEHLMSNRTTIMIAHRISTVLKADRILLLDKGRIQAVGTHTELLEKNELYQHLARLQFFDAPPSEKTPKPVAPHQQWAS